ncbi:MAG: TolC family protein [Bacteroidota bacterium]
MHQVFKRLKINKLFIIFFSIVFWLPAVSQTIDYNSIVVPEGQRPNNFEDYLVQLAWLNSPKRQILDIEKQKAEKEVDLQKTQWMDDVNFTFNINEVSLENVLAPDPDNFVLYPLYQLSAGVSLGSFTNNRKERELEEFDVKISEMEGHEYKMAIRAETLTRYQKLLLSIETLKVRVKAEEDAQNTYNLANQQFKNANLDLEDFLRASEAVNAATEKRLVAETDVELAKLALEELIGIKWESVLKYQKRYNK